MTGRLRIKTEFGERATRSESKEPRNFYLISVATEGKTEEQYFDGLHNLYSNGVIKIDRLVKYDSTDTKSQPNHVIELLDERRIYWEDHGVEPNEFWMIVDRDPQNINEDQLRAIISRCKTARYNLALSNPAFEFWLLLHWGFDSAGRSIIF